MRYTVEKRADGIIRWLERMKSAYTSGKVESAYIDAECARADLEDLRSSMFEGITCERHSNFWSITRAVILASAIIISSANPLSREKMPPSDTHTVSAKIDGEIVSPRTEESQPANHITHLQNQTASAPPKTRRTRKAPSPKRTEKIIPKTKPQPEKTVAYDKINALTETGQRALKNSRTVIKIK